MSCQQRTFPNRGEEDKEGDGEEVYWEAVDPCLECEEAREWEEEEKEELSRSDFPLEIRDLGEVMGSRMDGLFPT